MIRLLTRTEHGEYHFREFHSDGTPAYAILSHTWEQDNWHEVLYDDVLGRSGHDKRGYKKLDFCANQAAIDGLAFFWVDSCCINKRSEVELSEAINSMFSWYKNAARCYVYLSDVPRRGDKHSERDQHDAVDVYENDIRVSRWFKRGWTLQELLAPQDVIFYTHHGHKIGTKSSMDILLHEVTSIPREALGGRSLADFSVDQRLSWIEKRRTTREEDMVYSLLGIFDVNMTLIYGEGRKRALRRLWRAIDDNLDDDMITNFPKRHRTKNYQSAPGKDADAADMDAIIDALSFEQIDDRFQHISVNYFRTCGWLLEHPDYIQWLSCRQHYQERGFFWVKGHPGSGKSTLAKFVLTHLSNQRALPVETTLMQPILLSFFFNAHGAALERSATGLFRSLIVQILDFCPDSAKLRSALRSVSSAAMRRMDATSNSLKELLMKLLCNILRQDIMLLVDGLDECDENHVRDIVGFLEELGEQATADGWEFRVWLSSRHYPHISAKAAVPLALEDQPGHANDIVRYISGKLRIGTSEQAIQIQHELRERASGIFLWVGLVVDILNREYDHGQIRALRAKLRVIPDNLHDLSMDILRRDISNTQATESCLEWILYSRRPLSVQELYFAIVVSQSPSQGRHPWNPKAESIEDMERYILSASKGIAEVTTSTGRTVQLIHQCLRDFLLHGHRDYKIWPNKDAIELGPSHDRLKRCCCEYLAPGSPMQALTSGNLSMASSESAAESRDEVRTVLPLLEYAVEHIFVHAETAQHAGVDQGNFLAEFDLENWTKSYNVIQKYDRKRVPPDIDLLWIFAENDLPCLIDLYARTKVRFKAKETHERHKFPILTAMANANTDAFLALIQHEGVLLSRSVSRRILLEQDPGIFQFLLTQTHDTVCKFITSYPCEASWMRNKDGRTLMAWASQHGAEDFVRLLLAVSSDVYDQEEQALQTTLNATLKAALRAPTTPMKPGILRMILDKSSQSTILAVAYHTAHRGATGLVDMLLHGCADVKPAVALQLAARLGRRNTVQYLSQSGVDVSRRRALEPAAVRNPNGATAISFNRFLQSYHDAYRAANPQLTGNAYYLVPNSSTIVIRRSGPLLSHALDSLTAAFDITVADVIWMDHLPSEAAATSDGWAFEMPDWSENPIYDLSEHSDSQSTTSAGTTILRTQSPRRYSLHEIENSAGFLLALRFGDSPYTLIVHGKGSDDNEVLMRWLNSSQARQLPSGDGEV